MFRACGRFKAARFDLLDAPTPPVMMQKKRQRSNYMDLNDTSGFMYLGPVPASSKAQAVEPQTMIPEE